MTKYGYKLQERVIVRPFCSRTFAFCGVIKRKKVTRPETPCEQIQYSVLVPRQKGRHKPEIMLNGITESELEKE